ncbi:hypothetical protein GCM10011316_04470 [Roseibium aquae]|uniref:Uncharacterized protein n=1 Tax=Roseibium aquae TaxID=1323746 RepID=A0A916T9K1_9HYPH|nr:hypothetical protein [Roseibium aquae]GGB35454.1 hypothetical protein GCM10011316_04470 [Roseibium aquae]
MFKDTRCAHPPAYTPGNSIMCEDMVGNGLAGQFSKLENDGNNMRDQAERIRVLVERLKSNAFVNQCSELLQTVQRSTK